MSIITAARSRVLLGVLFTVFGIAACGGKADSTAANNTSLAATYTITASADSNGVITPSGATTVIHGASQTYTITPNSGYNIATLTVDGSSVALSTSYTFSNVQTNHTINATFISMSAVTYALTVTNSGGGTVASSPAGITCGGVCSANFASGTSVVLSAAPNSSYLFDGWSGGGCSGTGTCTVVMSAAQSVTAAFTYSRTTIALDESAVLVPQVKRLGLNLGGHNYWDQAQFMKSVINGNPGFEGVTHNVTVYCDAGTSGNTCVRATLRPDPAWHDSGSIFTGYWNGASYEIITGAAKGRTGTVTMHIGAITGSSWELRVCGKIIYQIIATFQHFNPQPYIANNPFYP